MSTGVEIRSEVQTVSWPPSKSTGTEIRLDHAMAPKTIWWSTKSETEAEVAGHQNSASQVGTWRAGTEGKRERKETALCYKKRRCAKHAEGCHGDWYRKGYIGGELVWRSGRRTRGLCVERGK